MSVIRYNFITKYSKAILIIVTISSLIIIGINLFENKSKAFLSEALLYKAAIKNGAEVTVDDSMFTVSGVNAYHISAKKVTKDAGGKYHLDDISGVYSIKDKNDLGLIATNGIISDDQNRVELKKDIKINYAGYNLLTERLDLDLNSKAAESNMLVRVEGEGGSVVANGFKATAGFNQIMFHGDVKADFNIGNSK